MVVLALLARDAPCQAATTAAACREGEVLVYLHVGRRAAHGVLEHAAQVRGAPVLRQACYVAAIELDGAAVGREDARDAVQERGLSGAVAADHGYEVAGLKVEVNAGERGLLVHGALVERLGDVGERQHQRSPPFRHARRAWLRSSTTGTTSASATMTAEKSFMSFASMPICSTMARMMK